MCLIKLHTKPVFRIFRILKINRIMLFCNLFVEQPLYIVIKSCCIHQLVCKCHARFLCIQKQSFVPSPQVDDIWDAMLSEGSERSSELFRAVLCTTAVYSHKCTFVSRLCKWTTTCWFRFSCLCFSWLGQFVLVLLLVFSALTLILQCTYGHSVIGTLDIWWWWLVFIPLMSLEGCRRHSVCGLSLHLYMIIYWKFNTISCKPMCVNFT